MRGVLIGKGGNAKVYRLWQEELGRFIVEKRSSDSLLWESFWMKKLHKFAVPDFYGVEKRKDGWVIQMEYLPGENLEQLMSRKCIKETSQITIMKSIVQEILLIKKEFSNLVFCDIKPSNIIVNQKNKITFIDFGAVVWAGNNRICQGTIPYAAPEILEGNPGKKSDIYSIGQIMEVLRERKKDFFYYWIIWPCIRKKEKQRSGNLKRLYRKLEQYERYKVCLKKLKKYWKIIMKVIVLFLLWCLLKEINSAVFDRDELIMEWNKMKDMYRMLLFIKLGRSFL